MNANEIKALKEEIEKDKQKLKKQQQLVEKTKLRITYRELSIKQKNLRMIIEANKIPQSKRDLVPLKYTTLFAKEIFLINVRFEGAFKTDHLLNWIERLLENLYKVDNIRLCLKEEDILPLDSFISEKDFIERSSDTRKTCPFSEIFTEKKLLEITSKIEDLVKNNASSISSIWSFTCGFNVSERIKYFSPEVNFIFDTVDYVVYDTKGDRLTYQTSLNVDPSLFNSNWFKNYINFLEGKIDPDLHTELFLTYCQ